MQYRTDELVENLRQIFSDAFLGNGGYYAALEHDPKIKGVAAVLAVLDFRDGEWQVLLTVRSKKLRRHPGEVSFPGGMKEVDDKTTTETALREAYEEIGLPPNYVQVVGPLMPFVSRHMIMLYPVLSVLCRPFVDYSLDAEVEKVFWTPLSNFLDDKHHNSFYFDKTFQLHNFLLEEPVFGLTAFICVVLALGIYNRLPRFQMDIISDRTVPPRRKMLDFVRNGSKLLPEINRDALAHAIKARL